MTKCTFFYYGPKNVSHVMLAEEISYPYEWKFNTIEHPTGRIDLTLPNESPYYCSQLKYLKQGNLPTRIERIELYDSTLRYVWIAERSINVNNTSTLLRLFLMSDKLRLIKHSEKLFQRALKECKEIIDV